MSQLIIIILLFSPAGALAQDRGSTEQEFKIKKEHLKQRHQDFFIRENEADRRDQRRQEASIDHKKIRQKIKESYESSRLEFVKNRKQKSVLSDEEHQKELAQQKKAHEATRLEYIRRRNELRRIEASTGVIPDWIEYKLYEPYETSDTKD